MSFLHHSRNVSENINDGNFKSTLFSLNSNSWIHIKLPHRLRLGHFILRIEQTIQSLFQESRGYICSSQSFYSPPSIQVLPNNILAYSVNIFRGFWWVKSFIRLKLLLQKQWEVQKAKGIKWNTGGALQLQHFAAGRMTKDWHRLSRNFVESFIRDIQKLSRHSPGLTGLGNPPWAGELDELTFWDPFQPPPPVAHTFFCSLKILWYEILGSFGKERNKKIR